MDGKFRFSIDRGGTFTDIYAEVPDPSRPFRVLKLLSEDPKNYSDAPREGIRRILEEVTGIPHPRDKPVPTARIASIRMGTTVATNALLERKGARMALCVTRGFRDLLHIGNQSRPLIFDLRIEKPENLYERVVEVEERLVLVREGEELPEHARDLRVVTGSTGERVLVEKAPDLVAVRAALQQILDAGITSLAVAFMHAYTVADHERLVGDLAKSMGFTQVSLSSDVMPMVKIVPRGYTACADAYLTPHIVKYVNSFKSGFENGLEPRPGDAHSVRLSFMQSDGGLTPVEFFSGHKAILSGPAGGVVGYALTTWDPVVRQPIVAFDMGGTSTDVSRFDGRFAHVYETSIAGISVQAPQLDISTVAAGGGSRLFFRSGLFAVGPESAGAHPGPVCYRKGGYLAVTDANLQLGRIVSESFPHIFGPAENEPLDIDATHQHFAKLAAEINEFYGASGEAAKSVDEIAYGFLKVANEAMCRPIRALTQMKGYDITTHVLACFGGAGPQHACAMARALGMKKIFISRFSGILSAYGLSLADVVNEAQAPEAATIIKAPSSGVLAAPGVTSPSSEAEAAGKAALAAAAPENVDAALAAALVQRLQELTATVATRLTSQGFETGSIDCELYLNLRYQGTDTAIMTPCYVEAGHPAHELSRPVAADPGQLPLHAVLGPSWTSGTISAAADARTPYLHAAVAAAAARFVQAYKREFGFVLQLRDILVDDVRVRGIARANQLDRKPHESVSTPLPAPWTTKSVYFEGGRVNTPVYQLSELRHGHSVRGPAMLIDKTSTIVVEPEFVARIAQYGDVEIVHEPTTTARLAEDSVAAITSAKHAIRIDAADPIQLSIFSHRFMGIAEQMGRVLQRTSISVNMRERLDYSCALFGPDGGLVANAPHIPVHLGAMQDAVRFQMAHWGDNLREGDVLVSNHPQLAGGSHLPDITVMTPVFSGGKIVFFVASRGHHADIGGIAPGSMPPMSKVLKEEGAAIVAFKLVEGGMFQEAGITDILQSPGRNGIPGSAGSRNMKDCISDLRAQVAANNKGIHLVKELIEEYSLDIVHAYMRFIQANAELAVREMLVAYSESRGLPEVGTVRAIDFMDDGTPIALAITINRKTRSAHFDFAGTGPEVFGNTNAPRAVTYSAIIYSLRCLVGRDVPLNQGCLAPVTIDIPAGTLLHPSPEAAVVGGNVLTSQRVVDVVLRAFGACAASQGCMNNLTLGDDNFGYYETIAGGAGAGPTWHGRSGVHTHMTNTRITDPEIFERRYPIVLRTFTLRAGSGGRGRFSGGDGVVREIEFRKDLLVSILSERRSYRPYGLAGGAPGARGINTLFRRDGRKLNLGGKNTIAVVSGERLRIETPGGGGYGFPGGSDARASSDVDDVTLEYETALAYARGEIPAAAAASASEADSVVATESSGGGAASAAFLFSGSVGRYKETQESV